MYINASPAGVEDNDWMWSPCGLRLTDCQLNAGWFLLLELAHFRTCVDKWFHHLPPQINMEPSRVVLNWTMFLSK